MKRRLFITLMAIMVLMVFSPTVAFCDESTDTISNIQSTDNVCDHSNTKTVKTKATEKKAGYKDTVCKDCGEVVKTTSISSPTVKLSSSSCTYDGKVHKPTVKVYTGSGKELKASNYKVSYAKGFKSIGKYKVTITFTDDCKNYTGKISKTFTVRPKKPTMKPWDLNAGNGFGLQWNILKDESKIDGYEVQWADNSDFDDANSLYIKKGYIGWSSSTMGLVNNTKYYCRIRSLTIKGDDAVYSYWSDSKSATYKGKTQSEYKPEDNSLDVLKKEIASDKSKAESSSSKGGSNSGGSNNTSHGSVCYNCGGSGTVVVWFPMYQEASGAMHFSQIPQTCSVCHGTGRI